jgi:hypothetical protein
MSKRAILLVTTNPVSEEREDELNTWYDEVHIPQILRRVPGITGCSRYRLDEGSPGRADHRYLAVYQIEADDPAGVVGTLAESTASGRLDSSDALGTSPPPELILYREL